jgi:hypothetical protein
LKFNIHLLFVGGCLLVVGGWWLFVGCWWLVVVGGCWLLVVGCWWLFVVGCWWLFVGGCLLVVWNKYSITIRTYRVFIDYKSVLDVVETPNLPHSLKGFV